MEPPFLVLRDGKRILASVPLALLFELHRNARRLMYKAIVSGDPASQKQIEAIFASLQPSDGRAIIMTLILQNACEEAEQSRREMQAYQAQQAQAQAAAPAPKAANESAPKGGGAPTPVRPESEQDKYFCVHGCPVGLPCDQCEALASKQARGKAA